jgi:hypothetical protein
MFKTDTKTIKENSIKQFEDVKRRLSNPVQTSASRIGKLLDKTINFGTLTRDTLTPAKYRKERYNLSKVNQFEFSTPRVDLTKSMSSAVPTTTASTSSTPIPLKSKLKLKSDSFNVISRSEDFMSNLEIGRNKMVSYESAYLNKSFEGVDKQDFEESVNNEESEKEVKIAQYRRIISEMNKSFDTKYLREKTNDDDEIKAKELNSLEIKGYLYF